MINNWIGEGYTTSLAAAGTTQATATLLSAGLNNVTTVAAGAGVQLPQVSPGYAVWIFNSGANPLEVYPPTGHQLNSLGVNTGTVLGVNTLALYLFAAYNGTTGQWFVNMSA